MELVKANNFDVAKTYPDILNGTADIHDHLQVREWEQGYIDYLNKLPYFSKVHTFEVQATVNNND